MIKVERPSLCKMFYPSLDFLLAGYFICSVCALSLTLITAHPFTNRIHQLTIRPEREEVTYTLMPPE